MTDKTAGRISPEILASLVLLAATGLALVLANSPLAGSYKTLLATEIAIKIGGAGYADPLKVWIKNALMTVFFLHVGLEIKAEFREGALADRRRATMPFVAALGGIVVPALIYLAVVGPTSPLAKGWAIPSATDIAFAIGVVGLLGSRVPASLKAFLLAVAVIDDLAAIMIIAVFYTGGLSLAPLVACLVVIAMLAVVNARGIASLWPYLLLGLLLWIGLSESGINPTIAGVIVAAFVPLKAGSGSPLHRLEHALKNPVVFAIMPIFAFANAGVPLDGIGIASLAEPVTLGVTLGLALGKPVGITLAVLFATRTGLAELPAGASLLQVVGVGFLAGIGFTMSLFIGALAFGEGAQMDQARLGVLLGSLIATIAGAAILGQAGRAQRKARNA
jgi:NhaA family Na+:H+ antiporter